MKMHLSCLISCLLLLGAVAQPVGAQQDARQPISVEETKVRIGKLGIGEKAKATITLKDGRKVKGYIYQTGDDDFIIRDRKTDAPTTINYADVAKVERNSGHSTARNIAIGIGIGVGAFLAIIAITIAHLD
ncbi:MAG TPA: hypothetical protein VJ180_14500 [Pyrinomonadaceae bacterium]|nr:hypothetical protein [Pyrinomonadaceae bacterium]